MNWSIPVVNHLWLEDCFVQWRNLSVGAAKYIDFPPGVDFAQLLGERGVGRSVQLDLEREDELRKEAETEEIDGQKISGPKRQEGQGKGSEAPRDTPNAVETPKSKKASPKKHRASNGVPVDTATSAKDAREVEEAVGLFDGADMDPDVPMDVDGDDAGMSVDNEHILPSKSPTKSKKNLDEHEGIADKPRSRLVRRTSTRKEPEKEEEHGQRKPGPSKTNTKAVIADLDDESEIEEVVVRPKAKPIIRKKTKASRALTSEDEDETDQPTPQIAAHTAKGKAKDIDDTSPIRTPKRVVSVVLPAASTSSKKKSTPLDRTESLRVKADEASVHSSPKRGRPAKDGTSTFESHMNGRYSVGDATSSRASTPPKRAAHLRASAHLHDVMMPDVLNYAQEKKRGFKGKDSERISAARNEKTNSRGKKRLSDATDRGQSSDEEQAERKKKRKISTGATRKISTKMPSDDESEVENAVKAAGKKVRITLVDAEGDDIDLDKVEKRIR